jgi:hypothetical protein
MIEKSTQKLTQQATIISICKYDQYQAKDDEINTQNNTVPTQCQHSANTVPTLDNNVKNEKKTKKVKKNISDKKAEMFERWWKSYPKRNGRRVGKNKAGALFKQIPENDWPDLKTATANYSAECNFHKDPERFLRNDFWKEYIKAPDKSRSTNDETDFSDYPENTRLLLEQMEEDKRNAKAGVINNSSENEYSEDDIPF